MSYFYRNAEDKDKDEVYELYRTVMKNYISTIWGWEENWQTNDFSAHYNAEEITIVLDDKKFVGYCHVKEKTKYLYIQMLVVIPAYQNKGIGKHLLESLKDRSNKNSKYISLEVFKINTIAKEFYKRHGFSIVGETQNSYIMKSKA